MRGKVAYTMKVSNCFDACICFAAAGFCLVRRCFDMYLGKSGIVPGV